MTPPTSIQSDIPVPPQQLYCGTPVKVSWLQRMWWELKLWWALRKPRKVIREAIAEAKAKKSYSHDASPLDPYEAYWETGPPPVVACEEEALKSVPPQELGKCECVPFPPRGTPQIGPPVDVEYHEGDESYKGASHA